MHPELSLVFLTVLGGIGQGIFIVLFFLKIVFGLFIPTNLIFLMLVSSLVLQMIGVSASLLHLAHPLRLWKAIRMIGKSWLSREVITGGLAFSATSLYLLTYILPLLNLSFLSMYSDIIAVIAFVGALSFLISSAMLYASIRYIKEWSNVTTPIMFFLTGITGGLAVSYTLLWAIYPLSNELLSSLSKALIFFTIISLITKITVFELIKRFYVASNLNTALGVRGSASIIQMDMGTPYEHFNTKEFSYPITNKELIKQKALVLSLGFILPLFLWFLAMMSSPSLALFISISGLLSMIGGFILERRLFFIQGNHVQNLYYNRFKSNNAKNPLLYKGKKEGHSASS